jgi:hypothetical protein
MGAGRSRVTNPNQTPNAGLTYLGSETAGEKLRRQKEKSPDHQLRSPRYPKWARKWVCPNNQEVGLEAATLETVRNS